MKNIRNLESITFPSFPPRNRNFHVLLGHPRRSPIASTRKRVPYVSPSHVTQILTWDASLLGIIYPVWLREYLAIYALLLASKRLNSKIAITPTPDIQEKPGLNGISIQTSAIPSAISRGNTFVK